MDGVVLGVWGVHLSNPFGGQHLGRGQLPPSSPPRLGPRPSAARRQQAMTQPRMARKERENNRGEGREGPVKPAAGEGG